MTLRSSTVSDNTGSGIVSTGPLTLTDSTVSGNVSANFASGGGIVAYDITLLVNSTISGNSTSGGPGGAINACGPYGFGGCSPLTLISSTISGNIGEPSILVGTGDAPMLVTNSLVDGDCAGDVTSNGYNIESPGNTCGFDQTGDQASVSAVLLDLQPLANNGGPTQTHAITTDSAAFNAGTCEVDEDQRGVTRPQGPTCDVGAFELEVAP